jgi:hypothetical protein
MQILEAVEEVVRDTHERFIGGLRRAECLESVRVCVRLEAALHRRTRKGGLYGGMRRGVMWRGMVGERENVDVGSDEVDGGEVVFRQNREEGV